MTALTIRFYQSVDVLPKPDRRGRAAVYHQKHLERLRLIAELRDRGLSLNATGHLLDRRPARARRWAPPALPVPRPLRPNERA